MANTDLLWRPTLLTAATFLINSAASNETGFSGLASGAAVSSSVSGASGVFALSVWGQAPFGEIEYNAGGAHTPSVSGALLGWFRRSLDGGTTFESLVATPSTAVPALERAPDFVIPFSNAALASGNRVKAAWEVRLPMTPFMVTIQNRSGGALPSSGTNWIKMVSSTYTSPA